MGKKRVSRSEYDRRLARRRATGRPRQTRAVRHDIQSSALTVAQLASDVREEIDILKAEIDAGQRTLEEKERFLANLLSAAGIQRASENGMRAHRTIRYDEVIPWLHATLRTEGNRAFAVEIYRRAEDRGWSKWAVRRAATQSGVGYLRGWNRTQRAILYLTDVNEYEGEDLERISQGGPPGDPGAGVGRPLIVPRRVRRFPISPTIGRHDVPPLFKELCAQSRSVRTGLHVP